MSTIIPLCPECKQAFDQQYRNGVHEGKSLPIPTSSWCTSCQFDWSVQLYNERTGWNFLQLIRRRSRTAKQCNNMQLQWKQEWDILFYKSNTIRIENLTIEDCGTKNVFINPYIVHTKTFTTMSALLFFYSYDIELIRLRINRNLEYGMFAERVSGKFTISNSAFLRCVVVPISKTTNIGSNVWILYRNDNHRRTSLLIEHSWFLYGGNKSKRAGGLSIFLNRTEVSVRIDYIRQCTMLVAM